MYKVTVDRSRAMICMTASGFFTMEALEESAMALHRGILSLGGMAGRHLTLYDYRGLKVVQGPVLDRYSRYFTDRSMQAFWARRVAFVCDSALLGLQLSRIQRENMRIFTDRAEAMTWLLADDDRAAA